MPVSSFALVLCAMVAQSAPTESSPPPSSPRVAIVALGANGAPADPAVHAQARAALEKRGFVVERADISAPLVAEAQHIGGVCTLDDAECWSKVGLYAGFERILAIGGSELVFVDVGAGKIIARARASDGVEALFAPPASSPPASPPAASPPAPAPASAEPLVREDAEPPSTLDVTGSSVPWLAIAASSAAVASLCFVSGIAFEFVAVDHLTRLRDGELAGLSVEERTRAAIDAERIEIASFVGAGVAGTVAVGAAALWWTE